MVEIRQHKVQALLDTLARADKIVIASHANPDADALGSTLALYQALKVIGKHPIAFNADVPPQILQFLPHVGEVTQTLPQDIDVLCVADCGEIDRVVYDRDDLERLRNTPTVFIDHHITTKGGEDSFVDVSAAATGELVYEIIKALGVAITPDIANCLMAAISIDTGSFCYSNTTARTLAIASDLVASGADPWHVAQGLYENRTESSIRLLSVVLNTLIREENGEFAYMHIDTPMYQQTQSNSEETEGVVNYARMIKGVEVAALFRQIDNDVYKVSFRSRGRVNVAAICQQFGGGGHHNAAGCAINGSFQQVLDLVRPHVHGAISTTS